eukprot:1146047-Pelagomonas_calceolata.AAC.7
MTPDHCVSYIGCRKRIGQEGVTVLHPLTRAAKLKLKGQPSVEGIRAAEFEKTVHKLGDGVNKKQLRAVEELSKVRTPPQWVTRSFDGSTLVRGCLRDTCTWRARQCELGWVK